MGTEEKNAGGWEGEGFNKLYIWGVFDERESYPNPDSLPDTSPNPMHKCTNSEEV